MAHAFVDDPIDLLLVIIPVYPDVMAASNCNTVVTGSHLVTDLSDLMLC